MSLRIPPVESKLRELELLVRAHHPLWSCETAEHERLHQLMADLAERVGLPLFVFTPVTGLVRQGEGGGKTLGTETVAKCLSFLAEVNYEGLFLVTDFGDALSDPANIARLKSIHDLYFRHRGTVVFAGASFDLPPDLEPLVSTITLPIPTPEDYYQYVRAVLADLATRRAVRVDLDSAAVGELLRGLSGLSFAYVRRIITRAVVDDGRLSRDDLPLVLEAKKRILERSFVLEFHEGTKNLDDVAGLANLKRWLKKRHRAFVDPESARRFGLEPPRGLLLLGVQGCGKSLSAKAIANEWGLPLVRLDPSSLYTKYLGESERNFRRAIATAESLAPVVLWIDEIEKAVGQSDRDGGTSQRVFGTFLTWLQEKKANVFVIATANDITNLPPELLRKGRFDEIFFVDLPGPVARRAILEIHLRQRGHDPSGLVLDAVVSMTEGWNGAELEQLVVSSLFEAFESGRAVDGSLLLESVRETRPLSKTMAEPIARLRAWCMERAVPADGEAAENQTESAHRPS